MAFEITEETRQCMDEFIRQDPPMTYQLFVVCTRFRKTGGLMAFWLTQVESMDGKSYSISRDPKRAHKFKVNEMPHSTDEFYTAVGAAGWDDHELVDFHTITMRNYP